MAEWQLAKVKEDPLAYGAFVPLPLPHIIETLDLVGDMQNHPQGAPDGYALSTSAGSLYLGSEEFEPIWETLNMHGAVLFVHPCDSGTSPIDIKLYPVATLEFPFDTARCRPFHEVNVEPDFDRYHAIN